MAVEVTTTVEEAKVQAALRPMPKAPADGKLVLDIGRKCSQPVDGAPTTVEELLAAIEKEGIKVKKSETRMACAACGCPELSVEVKVDPADGQRVLQLVHPWTPPAASGDALPTKDGPKGSLP
jgi:hypothetical protein